MTLPIYIIGSSVLKKKAEEITPDYPGLEELIKNMKETMLEADGVGLAAPQIGKSIRLFVVDASPFAEEEPALLSFKKVFINPQITEYGEEQITMNEGCLSIPGIHENIERPVKITIEYMDENFTRHTENLEGMAARIVQHEYDHIEGILFTDKVSSLRKKLLKRKLESVAKGKFAQRYRTVLGEKYRKGRRS